MTYLLFLRSLQFFSVRDACCEKTVASLDMRRAPLKIITALNTNRTNTFCFKRVKTRKKSPLFYNINFIRRIVALTIVQNVNNQPP